MERDEIAEQQIDAGARALAADNQYNFDNLSSWMKSTYRRQSRTVLEAREQEANRGGASERGRLLRVIAEACNELCLTDDPVARRVQGHLQSALLSPHKESRSTSDKHLVAANESVYRSATSQASEGSVARREETVALRDAVKEIIQYLQERP